MKGDAEKGEEEGGGGEEEGFHRECRSLWKGGFLQGEACHRP